MPEHAFLPVMAFAALSSAVLSSTAVSSLAAQQLVVPQSFATADAQAYGWIGGASRPVRQQTLIGASHLTALVGKTITALEFRRNVAPETYLGGKANVTLTLSIAPGQPLDANNHFATNAGLVGRPAYVGSMVIPTSPQPTAASVAWTPNNVIKITFSDPFVYTGGTLCVDLIGHPIDGKNANWWMADLALEDIAGRDADIGTGCGTYNSEGRWSYAATRSLLPGAMAGFTAWGPPNGMALALFGTPSPIGIPLSTIGLPASSRCNLWLSSIHNVIPTIFEGSTHPLDEGLIGHAHIEFKLPNSTNVFGLGMTTQWIDPSNFTSSNAVEWTVASTMPSLDMVLLEGHADEATGNLAAYMGHVMRFTYQ